ncbi:acyl-CoA dehydrogenase family protein [Microbacterium sp. NIBRBAC000506063]|uniref:acyl-CoA dehydrogenase family protein n=1 Tax=Microbacterium sp. NIBRBAC000506063 TaxID=2734618 RepID=UPI001CB70090|nr:acyl-CoA dehydrogenase family protein [Microbacterium sp. NIBRBAC000506063]
MKTHEVTNQPPARTGLDEYGTNTALVEGVERHDAAWAHERLHATGQRVGTAEFQADAAAANTREPVLRTHDRYGNRIDEVDYDESYHRIIAAAVSDGAHTSAYVDPRPGANVARAATFMLYAQVEPGHACPVSMTHSVVPVLQQHPDAGADWLPRVLSTSYDPALRPGKGSALFGMAMTEKQGGSDVRANTTSAQPLGEGRYALTGHKWFCSAPMSDAFLVLAQAPAGLSCFLLPGCARAVNATASASSASRTSSATGPTPPARSSMRAPRRCSSARRGAGCARSSTWLPARAWTASTARPRACGRPSPRPPGMPGTVRRSVRCWSISRR